MKRGLSCVLVKTDPDEHYRLVVVSKFDFLRDSPLLLIGSFTGTLISDWSPSNPDHKRDQHWSSNLTGSLILIRRIMS